MPPPYPMTAAVIHRWSLRAERDLDLDLHGAPTGQRGHADRRARVPPGVAEHLVQESARAVDDRGLLCEARCRRHEPEHGEDPLDPIEIAELAPQHRDGVQSAPSGRV